MPFRLPASRIRLTCLLALGLLLGTAHGAELGEPMVRSFLGQPLVADIELTAVTPEEAANLQVKVARPDVYRGANISVNPVLSSLHLSLARRDGRIFLHITSTRPVETEFLNLFLELGSGGVPIVRSALLWFSADPRAPYVPAPVTAVTHDEPAPQAAAPAPAVRHPAPLHAAPAHAAAPAPAHAPVPDKRKLSQTHLEALALAEECAVLDAKNTVLTGQIVQLEGKVKLLQAALAPKIALPPPPVAAAPVSASAASASAARASAPPAARDVRKKTDNTRLYWIGGGAAALLALIAAVVVVVMKKRGKGKKAKPEEEAAEPVRAKPSLWARLSLLLMLLKKSKEPDAAAE